MTDAAIPRDSLTLSVRFNLSEDAQQTVFASTTAMFAELAPLGVHTEVGVTGAGPAIPDYLATIAAIAGAAGGVASVATAIAQAITAWRHRIREGKVQTHITLSAPGKPLLDLDTASDAQIHLYIIEIQQSSQHDQSP